jgi:hypothetical protein
MRRMMRISAITCRNRCRTSVSHLGEREDEVAHFSAHNTNFGAHDFTRYLMLMIAADEDVQARLTETVRAEVGPHPLASG